MSQPDFYTDYSEEVLVELDRLQEVALGQVELQRELLETLIEVVRVNIEAIQNALPASDYLTVSKCSHQIKGAAANVGVPSIRGLAAELERQAKAQNLLGAAELLAALENQRSRVQAFISSQLS
ncbi:MULTISPECIES: Hpt domain-containing protein [unclassified Coleofasciculus]|uniref:Hpt domain-containing protein n=1 Tax=unclassified Coleofasciculus TaxID=2692782 RepID=UPI00187FD30A|nr:MULTISPECIES: Hpt domain-containing protein [unclassified Coleofasciculus]MBE9128260.1 Hpt domain-containing protein [Coleofasciculus sp. LEGE 07081]MBE9151304.1 Hpt domain-containing protein [Coleofasciculus sp. LEGE 07092]